MFFLQSKGDRNNHDNGGSTHLICILFSAASLLAGWRGGGPRDSASLGRQTGWTGKALAGLGKYSWTQPGWGGKEVNKGVLLEENIGWGAFVTHAHFQ